MDVNDVIKVMTMALKAKDFKQVDTLANLVLSGCEDDINNKKNSNGIRYIDVSEPIEFMLLDKYYFSNIRTEVVHNDYGKILYLQANALSSMENWDESKEKIQEALYWSPINSKYLAEYSYILAQAKEWEKCSDVLQIMGKYAYRSTDFAQYLRKMGFLMCDYKGEYKAAIGFYMASLAYERSQMALYEINLIGTQKLFMSDIFNDCSHDVLTEMYEAAKSMGSTKPSDLVIHEIITNYNEAVDNGRDQIAKYFLSIMHDLKLIDREE